MCIQFCTHCVQSCALHTNGRTTTILRSGIICFGIAQTIYTNWERRLAVRADNIRPYEIAISNKIKVGKQI